MGQPRAVWQTASILALSLGLLLFTGDAVGTAARASTLKRPFQDGPMTSGLRIPKRLRDDVVLQTPAARIERVLSWKNRSKETLESIKLSADGSTIAVAHRRGQLSLIDVESGALRSSLHLPADTSSWAEGSPESVLVRRRGARIRGMKFVANGNILIAVNESGHVAAVDVETGRILLGRMLGRIVSSFDASGALLRFVIGTDRGAIEEYSLLDFSFSNLVREADDLSSVACTVYADKSILTAVVKREVEASRDRQDLLNTGINQWKSGTGQLERIFSSPRSTFGALRHHIGGKMLAGAMGGVVAFDIKGELVNFGGSPSRQLFPMVVDDRPYWVANAEPLTIVDGTTLTDVAQFTDSHEAIKSLSIAPAAGDLFACVTDSDAAVYRVIIGSSLAPLVKKTRRDFGTRLGISLSQTRLIQAFDSEIKELEVSDSGRYLGARSRDGLVAIYDRDQETLRKVKLELTNPGVTADLLSFDESEKHLYVADQGSSSIFRVSTFDGADARIRCRDESGDLEILTACSVGDQLVAGCRDRSLRVLDQRGEVRFRLISGGEVRDGFGFRFLKRVPQSRFLVASPERCDSNEPSQALSVFDTKTWKLVSRAKGLEFRWASFELDGSRLYLSALGEVCRFDLENGHLEKRALRSKLGTRFGIASLSETHALIPLRRGLELIKAGVREFESKSLPVTLEGITSLTGCSRSQTAYIGLHDGAILELAVR